jgi:hypothetical protein
MVDANDFSEDEARQEIYDKLNNVIILGDGTIVLPLRVQIEETGVICDLSECFPDGGAEYDEARDELRRLGEYEGGGGAAPRYRLVRVD